MLGTNGSTACLFLCPLHMEKYPYYAEYKRSAHDTWTIVLIFAHVYKEQLQYKLTKMDNSCILLEQIVFTDIVYNALYAEHRIQYTA